MTDNKKGTVAPETKKRSKRGVSNETRTVSIKRFGLADADPSTALFKGALISVDKSYITIGEDSKGDPQFNGKVIPKLVFHFASLHASEADKRHVFINATAQPSTVDTLPDGKDAWKVDSIFSKIKHVLDVVVLNGKPLTEEMEDALCLPFEDFDENGSYIPLDVDTIIAGWNTLFDNVVTLFNGDGSEVKPRFLDEKGNTKLLWMKLIRHNYDSKKSKWNAVDNGNLSFPAFVGDGVIELYRDGVRPYIKLNITKESIKEREAEVKQQPAIPGMMGGIQAGGGMIPPMPMGDGSAPTAFGGDDMPF